jgi:hypothetical protein
MGRFLVLVDPIGPSTRNLRTAGGRGGTHQATPLGRQATLISGVFRDLLEA